jgi:hypothetical protein
MINEKPQRYNLDKCDINCTVVNKLGKLYVGKPT